MTILNELEWFDHYFYNTKNLCNAYLFNSADTDKLTFGTPFSGNLKVILAATSETGIPSQLVAGRQGTFTSSTDPLYDPQWVQYEADVTSLAELVDETFNGVVAKYAKDNVWTTVDAGASYLRWAPKFDGTTTYITIPTVSGVVRNKFYIIADDISGYRMIANSDNSIYSLFILDGKLYSGNSRVPVIVDGVQYSRGVFEVSVGVKYLIEIDGENYNTIGYRPTNNDRFFSGVIYDTEVGGVFRAFDESFDSYPTLSGSAVAYNFVESDVVGIEV